MKILEYQLDPVFKAASFIAGAKFDVEVDRGPRSDSQMPDKGRNLKAVDVLGHRRAIAI